MGFMPTSTIDELYLFCSSVINFSFGEDSVRIHPKNFTYVLMQKCLRTKNTNHIANYVVSTRSFRTACRMSITTCNLFMSLLTRFPANAIRDSITVLITKSVSEYFTPRKHDKRAYQM